MVVDRMGDAYPELIQHRDFILSQSRAGGRALPRDGAHGPHAAGEVRRLAQRARRPEGAPGRRRLRPVRDLRLPLRPDGGDRPRAGLRHRRGGLRDGEGEALRGVQGRRRRRAGVEGGARARRAPGRAREGRPGGVHRLRAGGRRGAGGGPLLGRRRRIALRGGHAPHRGARSGGDLAHAVLRRGGRPGRGHRGHQRRRVVLQGDRHAEAGARAGRFTSGWSPRAPSRWASRSRSPSTARPARRRGATTARRTCCTGRCARCSARTRSRRAPRSPPRGCASTTPRRARSRTTRWAASRTSSTRRCWPTRPWRPRSPRRPRRGRAGP